MAKYKALIVLGTILVIGMFVMIGMLAFGGRTTSQTVLTEEQIAKGENINVGVNPTATYATIDKFSNTAISGTSYYRKDGESYSTTAISNVDPGVSYDYWVSNQTYYVKPYNFKGKTLNNNVVNKNAFQNTSVTLSLYDNTDRAVVTNGKANATLASGGSANIELTYQGVDKKSAIPFGGVLAIEMNSTISSVTCSGDGIVPLTADSSHLSYTVGFTTHKVVLFGLSPTFDTGEYAIKRINCQFTNSNTLAGSITKTYFTIYPANYYVANDGNLYLDVEKNKDDSTERVGLGAYRVQMDGWA